jgi:uncharacterized membrane protein YoaK (UPF0700 family)
MDNSANPTMEPDHWEIGAAALSVEDTFGTKLLPFVLSITAGGVDVISFLGLGGLFTAHITGNLVILAAKLVAGEQSPVSYLISVPVFMAVLALTRLLAAGLERLKIASLVPLLLIQFLLLAAFFALCRSAGPRLDPNTTIMILAGMLGVSAMAVQNGLARISLRGAPATAVMTTNITLFTIDVGQVLLGGNASSTVRARERARNTWPAIVGFLLGCALGAACEAAFGLHSLVLPAAFGLLAVALGLTGTLHHADAARALERRDQHDKHQA